MRFVTYDTETTGLDRHRGARMFAFSTCDWSWRTDVRRLDCGGARTRESEGALDELWGDDGKRRFAKVMHNARFDIGMTRDRLGRPLLGHEIHETMALSHILYNQRKSHALDVVAHDHFGYPRDRDDLVARYKGSENGFRDIPEMVMDPYQRADAERTMLLFKGFYPRVIREGYGEIYETERRLAWTTLAIEERGVMVDRARCLETMDWLRRAAGDALADFRGITGVAGSSPSKSLELGHILFEKMGFPSGKRTKGGGRSTDKFVLMELRERTRHPVFDAIFKYRSYSRGVKTLAGYLDFCDGDDVIHPSIHPYQAETGRASCSKPNLFNVETEGRLVNPFPIPARRAFRPKPGYVNFHLDYKGIQPRIFIDHSKDPEFTKILINGGDPHDAAAEELYGSRYKNERNKAKRKAMRNAGKSANLGIAFGAAIKTTARTLGMSIVETEPGYRRYKTRFPGLATLNARDAKEVREKGCVITTLGRKLSVPSSTAYMGTVYRTQGDEAGIMKRAENRVHEYLERATGGEAGIILPIYDELIIEWPRRRLRDARACLREVVALMTDFPQFGVPLEVEVEVSAREWTRKKPYSLKG